MTSTAPMGPHAFLFSTETQPVPLKLGQNRVRQGRIRDAQSLESTTLGAELRPNFGTITRTRPSVLCPSPFPSGSSASLVTENLASRLRGNDNGPQPGRLSYIFSTFSRRIPLVPVGQRSTIHKTNITYWYFVVDADGWLLYHVYGAAYGGQ